VKDGESHNVGFFVRRLYFDAGSEGEKTDIEVIIGDESLDLTLRG